MDGIGWDGYPYTAVTPRASLQSDANKLNTTTMMKMMVNTNMMTMIKIG